MRERLQLQVVGASPALQVESAPAALPEGGPHYLEHPPSKIRGGLEKRRPDWGNPWAAVVLDADVVKHLQGCGHTWESFKNTSTGERKVRLTDYCHERLFCGVCATSEANERASTWIENFRAVAAAFPVDVAGLQATFTIPAALSSLVAAHPKRREVLSALFRGVHRVMEGAGVLGWVVVMHAVSSKHPERPHVHFIVFYPGVAADGSILGGWMDREAFAARRRAFLGAWNRELAGVCKAYELGGWVSENVHLSYSREVSDLSSRLHYEMRPPLQDAFIHGRDSAEQLREAVSLALAFLYPSDEGKQAFRRIRAGGRFAPRVLTGFMESLGYQKREKEDTGEWVSEGLALLVAEGEVSCSYVLVNTGEVFTVPKSLVSVAGHGCPYEWVRPPGGGRGAPPELGG